MRKLMIILGVIAVVVCAVIYVGTADFREQKKIYALAEFAQEQYAAGNLAVGKPVNQNNISEYADDTSKAYKILAAEYAHYQVVLMDENTVLVQTGVEFQMAEGYIVSEDALASGMYKVPFGGYDANVVKIGDAVAERLYTYTAGL